MTFEGLVQRLQSLYDVDQPRAVDVANERLQRMVGQAKSLRAIVSLGSTVAGQATYPLAANIVQIFRVTVAFSAGPVTFKGTETLDALMDLQTGGAAGDGRWYAVAPDADASQVTNNLFLAPAPSEAGAAISGLCAVLPASLVYASATALPIPLDLHSRLLAGCKAELSDEESRQDEALKLEGIFEAGARMLEARANSLAKGSDRRRMRFVGYDVAR